MKSINIEIADTPDLLSQGLMFRKELDKNSGMLFKFPGSSFASFWGKNTYLPLDIAFISKEGTVLSQKEIVPMSTKVVRSDFPCQYALEVNSGFFKNNDINIGTQLLIDEENGKISFKKQE